MMTKDEIIHKLEKALQAYHWGCVSENVASKEADDALYALKQYRENPPNKAIKSDPLNPV